jgi:DNA-binding CsgD family transcriptional regulator
MRVVLVGSHDGLERLRSQLDDSIEIAGEFATLAEARAADVDVDALLVAPDRARNGGALAEPLTAREIEVLERLAEGLSNKAIAAQLGISDQTVKFHVAAITGKLGVTNRTEAVRHALRRGLIAL